MPNQSTAKMLNAWNWLKHTPEGLEGLEAAPSRPLAWHPSELAKCISARGAHLPAPLTEIELAELRTAHERWHADSASTAMIENLGKTAARVVVAGQQPDLLAGPLLVVYKVAAAIKLARDLQATHPDLNIVPVFWLAAEDHDFDEIRRLYWPGQAGQLEEFFLPAAHWQPGQMVGNIEIGAALEKLLEHVEATTFRNDYRGDVLALVREAYAEGANLETAFARLLLRMFQGTGLVVVSPLMTWLRRRAAPIMAHEFAHPGESGRRVMQRGEALRSAGVDPSLHRPADAINAFWIDEIGRRYTLRIANGEVRRALATGVNSGTAPLDEEHGARKLEKPCEVEPQTLAALAMTLSLDPMQFSTNVVTRPMLQDSALPTVAQIVGPGEASYLAQVEAVYEEFGVFTPLRFPRPQLALIEPRVARNLAKYELSAEEVLTMRNETLVQRAAERTLESGDLKTLGDFRETELAQITKLAEQLAKPGSGVEGAFQKLQQAMGKGFDTIRERILAQHQQDEQHVAQALMLLSNSLRPADAPQERKLNPIVPFACNYGLGWVGAMLERMSIDPALAVQYIALADLVSSRE